MELEKIAKGLVHLADVFNSQAAVQKWLPYLRNFPFSFPSPFLIFLEINIGYK